MTVDRTLAVGVIAQHSDPKATRSPVSSTQVSYKQPTCFMTNFNPYVLKLRTMIMVQCMSEVDKRPKLDPLTNFRAKISIRGSVFILSQDLVTTLCMSLIVFSIKCSLGSLNNGLPSYGSTSPAPKTLGPKFYSWKMEFDACQNRTIHTRATK